MRAVVVVFGLFSRVGGVPSALGALAAGTAVWVAGHLLEWQAPFLGSMLAAGVGYLLLAWWGRGAGGAGAPVAPAEPQRP